MKKTLVVVAHPNMTESKISKRLCHAIKDIPNLTLHNLYEHYSESTMIDVAHEQQLLLNHDRIIFQFPLYWFSTPSLLKEWQDKVLTYGFAYGKEGNKLTQKEFKVVVTTGSSETVYQPGGYHDFTISEILRPLQAMAQFTQMIFTQSFIIDDAMKLTDERLQFKIHEYMDILQNENWLESLKKSY